MPSLSILAALAFDSTSVQFRSKIRDSADDDSKANEKPLARFDLADMAKPDFGPAARDAAMPVAPSAEKNVFAGDFLIAGLGAVLMPSYEGANETKLIPGGAIAGRVRGIGINPRAAGLALNLIPSKDGAKIGLSLGPVARLHLNRSGRVADPVVARLGKLRSGVEFGIAAGVRISRVFNKHDQLSFGADIRWDISGRGAGRVISPSINYLTPVSRAQVVGLHASADFVDRRNARYNYQVTPAGSAASGLPVYNPRGGMKAINVGAFTGRDLSGNFLDGGFAIGVGAMYTRLTGSAAETPITRLRGRRSQWVVAAGLSYTF